MHSEFPYHSENFAMIAKFCYYKENPRHSENEFSLCTVTFDMIANFRYHSKNMA